MLQQGLDGTYTAGKMVREQVEELFSLQNAEDTMDVIRKVDGFYNRLVDPHFEKEHGTLEQVLSVREADLKNSTGRISWMKMPQKPHWKR